MYIYIYIYIIYRANLLFFISSLNNLRVFYSVTILCLLTQLS